MSISNYLRRAEVYEEEEDYNEGVALYRLIPKVEFEVFTRCLLAESLGRQGYLEGACIPFADQKFVDNGECIVGLTQEGDYQVIPQEKLIDLLQHKEFAAEKTLSSRLLKQLSPENSVKCFVEEFPLAFENQRALSFNLLLQRPFLPVSVLKNMHQALKLHGGKTKTLGVLIDPSLRQFLR